MLAAAAALLYTAEILHLRAALADPAAGRYAADLNGWHRLDRNTFPVLFFSCLFLFQHARELTRAFVSKLPGVEPHRRQRRSESARIQRLPADWPPVPRGHASWTRRVPRLVPPGVEIVWAVATVCFQSLEDPWPVPTADRYALQAALGVLAAVCALGTGTLNLVRLRHYAAWPGAEELRAPGRRPS
jgi:hypothetical protein